MSERKADIAVVGASLGGVLAAWRACASGRQVVLLAEHRWIGGQMTAQGVPPDEHHLIEHGGASESYLAFRRAMRAHYLSQADFIDRTEMTEGCNPGDGWVSRLCFEPQLAADYFEALLKPYVDSGQLVIHRRVSLQETIKVEKQGARIQSLTVKSSAGEALNITAAIYLDATDTGALIKQAGLPYRLGKESHDEFGECDAAAIADACDQQPVTFVMALKYSNKVSAPIVRPDDYDFWRRYVLPHYSHALFSESMPGAKLGQSTTLPLFAPGNSGQILDWWRYRRVVSSRNWRTARDEVSLINWAQNDYGLYPLLDGEKSESQVCEAAHMLSRAFMYWLQTEAPRRDDTGRQVGKGYPELQPSVDTLGTLDGFAQQVYVRESRRIVADVTLTQTDIISTDNDLEPVNRSDSVGVAWYNMDIHPTVVSGHGVNARVRPFTLPLGAFVQTACPNLIPACKNIGVTHLVNAATRVHPIEWLIGEVAGIMACHVLQQSVNSAANVAAIFKSIIERSTLQKKVSEAGIPLAWDRSLLEKLKLPNH
jgi:FAD dependent oxidoreductase